MAQDCTVQCSQPRNGLLLTSAMMQHDEWMHTCRLDLPKLPKLMMCVSVMQYYKWTGAYTLNLIPLVQLRYLRLVNISPRNVIVRSGCMVSVDLYSDSLQSPLYTNTTCAIRTAKWTLMLTV